MKKTALSLAIGCAIAMPSMANETWAQAKIVEGAVVEDVGAQERINLSGKLRMLSQRLPSAACHLAEGVSVETSKKILQGATAEFEQILTGLEFGDDSLNIIGEEKRRKTIVKIHALRDRWEPVKAASEKMLTGDMSNETLDYILTHNMDILEAAKLLVSELVGQYSDPSAMIQADAMVIDIAGRQRMLTQKMAKESCMLESHHETAGTADALQGTMQMFEISLTALRFGMEEAGIKAPPNAEIEAQLDVVLGEWEKAKPMLEGILAGGIPLEQEEIKFNLLNTTMGDMNKAVGMYAQAAKLGL